MNILFSPEYSGHLHINVNNNDVLMDTIAVNTIGLLEIIELRLGQHYNQVEATERLAKYYGAMNKYIKEHPNSIFAKSFTTLGLNTAKAVLAWRDELRMAEWKFESNSNSKRLNAIADIEKYFSVEKEYDIVERINIAVKQIQSFNLDCGMYSIQVNCDTAIMQPIVQKLINTLKAQGAIITKIQVAKSTFNNNLSKIRRLLIENKNEKITLNTNDESILIYKFPDEHSALKYFSHTTEYNDAVWINSNNKAMDHWLALANMPCGGSITQNCSPQLSQLFVTGIGLFSTPLNVKLLINWLKMPLLPLKKHFCELLSTTIARTGGYRNEECKELIGKYINGDLEIFESNISNEEIETLKNKYKKKRQKDIDTFLPPMENSDTISCQKLNDFCLEFINWSQWTISINKDNTLLREQLATGTSMAKTFCTLLNSENKTTIDYKTIESWLNVTYNMSNYTSSIAEQNCRTIIDSPSKIVSPTSKIVWFSFDGTDINQTECNFLSQNERVELTDSIHFWNEDCERKYYETQKIIPFVQTEKQLILVVCELKDGEPLPKHPLLLRIEKMAENIEIIERNNLQIDSSKLKVASKIIKEEKVPTQLTFEKTELIQWPKHITPTIISTLVEHPADFMMSNLLGINQDEIVEMNDVKRTSGNVAHAIIETLFTPRNGNSFSTADEIKIRITDEYETIYKRTIEEKGAILLLKENKLEEERLNYQLKGCICYLLKIIEKNKLKVSVCEKKIKSYLDLGLPPHEDDEQYDVSGIIDMTLCNENNELIIFDFKWSSNHKSYHALIKENRSIQLELYRKMLSKADNKNVKTVAYFLMPDGILYSTTKLENGFSIKPENENDITEQLQNSIRYRIQQINNGILETTGLIEDIDYAIDTKSQNLYPLKEEKNKDTKLLEKVDNKYTNYKIIIPR